MKTALSVWYDPECGQTEGSGHVTWTFHTSGCTQLQLPYVFLQWKRLNCIKWWCSECDSVGKLAEHILGISPKLSKLTSKYWANITVGLCQDRSYYDAIDIHFQKGCQIKVTRKALKWMDGGNMGVVGSSQLTFLPEYLQISLQMFGLNVQVTTQGYHWPCTTWWAVQLTFTFGDFQVSWDLELHWHLSVPPDWYWHTWTRM